MSFWKQTSLSSRYEALLAFSSKPAETLSIGPAASNFGLSAAQFTFKGIKSTNYLPRQAESAEET